MSVLNFLKSEDGAVTVDWVVLTASIIALGIVVVATIAGGATNVSSGVGTNIGDGQVAELDFSNVNG